MRALRNAQSMDCGERIALKRNSAVLEPHAEPGICAMTINLIRLARHDTA